MGILMKEVEHPPVEYITRTGHKITVQKLKGYMSVEVSICYKYPIPGAIARNITTKIFKHYITSDVTVAMNKIVYMDMLGEDWSSYMYKGNFVEEHIRRGTHGYA